MVQKQKTEYKVSINFFGGEPLLKFEEIIKPLIEKGQSIYTILENHKEISLCPKTLYTYIEMGLFNDWGINNLSLKRKVKRKLKNKKLKLGFSTK